MQMDGEIVSRRVRPIDLKVAQEEIEPHAAAFKWRAGFFAHAAVCAIAADQPAGIELLVRPVGVAKSCMHCAILLGK